ncbi:MAG: type II secretion system F family protein, partial [Thermoleophilia bacterium]|nr:type II secretion system F family protein [Thermoleophilia bacterium]
MTDAGDWAARAGAGARWHKLDERIERLLDLRGGAIARDREFADLLRAIAAAARTGVSLPAAIRKATNRMHGPITTELAATASRIEFGLPVEEELARFATRVDMPAATMLAQIIGVQHRRGGDLAAPCHRLAAMLHERCQLDAEARSATAQARFSARAVLAIPPLLIVLAAFRAPEVLARMATSGMALVLAPGVLLMVAGGLVARRIARHAGAAAGGAARPVGRVSRMRPVLDRWAGTGSRSRASLRLAAGVSVVGGTLVSMGGVRPLSVVCLACGIGAALAWPWSDRMRQRRELAVVAGSGIESLLELSIALFAAGATPHEVATIAARHAGGDLRAALGPAVHRLALGRSIPGAFAGLPVVA